MSNKISIVTPTFNHGKFIKDAIESVLHQNYENFEHIIIDGGSQDETISILKKYKHLIWISEKDNGPVDAIKKGFNIAQGNILTWLNSDDYFKNDIFADVNNIFDENIDVELLIGSVTFVDKEKNILFEDKTHQLILNNLLNENADLIRQPCTFYRTELYQRINGLDDSLKLAFDYDMFIKMIKVTNPYYIDKTLAYQRDFPDTLSRYYTRKQAIEIYKVARKNGGKLISRLNYTNLKKFFLKRF